MKGFLSSNLAVFVPIIIAATIKQTYQSSGSNSNPDGSGSHYNSTKKEPTLKSPLQPYSNNNSISYTNSSKDHLSLFGEEFYPDYWYWPFDEELPDPKLDPNFQDSIFFDSRCKVEFWHACPSDTAFICNEC